MEEFKEFYNEIKSMSKKDLTKIAIPKFVSMLDKAKQIGYSKVIKEFPDINDVVRQRIAEFDADEGINIVKTFFPLIFDTVVDYIANNADVREKVEKLDDISLKLALKNSDYAITIFIKNGKFEYKLGKMDNVDITLIMSKETMQKFMAGKSDPMSLYMSGEVEAEGDINRIPELQAIMEFVSEEFGIDFLHI